MDERAKRDMAAIKAREADIREAMGRGARQVDAGQFTPAQLGLRPIYADRDGALWRDDGGIFTRLGYVT